jgi:hypothetical protein
VSDSYPTEPAPVPAPGEADPASQVAAASEGIAGVGDGPLDEAVLRLDALHRELQAALADLDQG